MSLHLCRVRGCTLSSGGSLPRVITVVRRLSSILIGNVDSFSKLKLLVFTVSLTMQTRPQTVKLEGKSKFPAWLRVRFFILLETGSYYGIQAGLTLLSHPPESWEYRLRLPHPAFSFDLDINYPLHNIISCIPSPETILSMCIQYGMHLVGAQPVYIGLSSKHVGSVG